MMSPIKVLFFLDPQFGKLEYYMLIKRGNHIAFCSVTILYRIFNKLNATFLLSLCPGVFKLHHVLIKLIKLRPKHNLQ